MAGPIDEVMYENAVVIRPNVRGSRGYGKTYESLDDREHREDAVRDIGALLDWIAKQPGLDPERVVVTGGSYGGYMTLATLIHSGSRVRCGVELVGVSHWPAFLEESEKGHYPEAQRGEYGDSREPAMRQFLLSISPSTHADQIRVPLMIYQGANDVRVKPQQSRVMVQRIRGAGGQVTYLEAANEGHTLDQPLTQFYMGIASMEFLERCLGR
jgi:dipeptidyl aminopeptidase/acylaminoacyl peptidase